jgi:hypothetical protein
MCAWLGVGHLGAAWTMAGQMLMAGWSVGIYVADIAPTVACLIILAMPAVWYWYLTCPCAHRRCRHVMA